MKNQKSKLTRKMSRLGRKGGSVSSDKKKEAAKLNGAKGGRPRKFIFSDVENEIVEKYGVMFESGKYLPKPNSIEYWVLNKMLK